MNILDSYENASCSDHPLIISRDEFEQAETLVCFGSCACGPIEEEGDCGGYCDRSSFGLAKTKDGKYLTIEEWSDTSGHGCQCGGSAQKYNTLDDALNLGLNPDYREIAKKVLESK